VVETRISFRVTAESLQAQKRTGIQGHLHLICARDEKGDSFLRRQSFRVPVHLSKPFLNDGVLIVNVVTPTAGIFSGDCVEIDVRVEPHARMLLTTPSAARVHRMKGGHAKTTQRFFVAAHAHLEIWPEILIPQAGSRYAQTTRIDVERHGQLLFIEMVAPGRVASGEAFAFDQLKWETDIFYDGNWIVRERYQLSPATLSLRALSACFPQAYHATCFVVNEHLDGRSPCWKQILDLQGTDIGIGCSQLVHGGSVVKILARDSICLRKCIAQVRGFLYASAGWRLPATRRI
jgi:urease accessory protein